MNLAWIFAEMLELIADKKAKIGSQQVIPECSALSRVTVSLPLLPKGMPAQVTSEALGFVAIV